MNKAQDSTSEIQPRVLIVSNDPIVGDSISDALKPQGFDTATCMDGPEAVDMLHNANQHSPAHKATPFHVVITDLKLATTTGLDLLSSVRTQFPDTVVIVATAYGTIHSAVKAIKLGAFDYLTHPIIEEELALVVHKATRHGVLLAQTSALKGQLEIRDGLDNIIGGDPRMIQIYELIRAVAPTKTTVLMNGESGTGKSLIARAIHRRSLVADGPFVEISCGSIPETLLESELFGHVKGAFTGAHADKIGRFLAADGGTIFLDEINSASPGMQLKLLRVLQERRFEPVGSTDTVEVNVRVLLASNQPLENLVASGEFRQDLYYRINVVAIDLPPLRDRVSDIMLLANHFLVAQCKEHSRHIAGFTDNAADAMMKYIFPGNIRELENIIERAVVLSTKGTIHRDDLPPTVLQNLQYHPLLQGEKGFQSGSNAGEPHAVLWDGQPLSEVMESYEREVLIDALNANNWNRQQTSEQLDINRTTLYKKIKHHNLDDWAEAS